MNPNRRNLLLVSIIAGTVLCDQSSLAQSQSQSAPQPAPSFLRQAGQKLFESAQKKVLHNVNEQLQGKTQTAAPPNPKPGASGTNSLLPSTPYGTPNNSLLPGSPYGNNGQPPGSAPPNSLLPAATLPPRQAPPVRSWVNSQEKPFGCLLCVHGLGLQSNSYEFFGKEASRRGIAVYALDVRGFGSWMNAGGKTKVNFDDCLLDIKQTLEAIRASNPGVPVYILGESMGGAIALRAASMYPTLIDGLVSSVPAAERFNQGKTSMKVFLNLLTGVNIANVGNDLVNQATQNSKLKAQWKDDPLSRLNLSPQELIQFQDFMNFNHDAARKVADMPVLFVQGIGDQLVKPEGTWELFNEVAAKDKSFFAVPGEHLIFEEAQTQDAGPRDQNFRVISSWLSTKVGRRHRSPGDTAQGGGGFRRPSINIQGLEGPAQMIDNGQYANAISELERINATERPNDPNVLGLLGRAYYKSGQPDKAGYLFRSAMRVGRGGGEQAQAINSYLLDMSKDAQSTGATSSRSPFAGFGGMAAATTSSGLDAAPAGKVKIYAFYANWADQCKGMTDAMKQLASNYGNTVDITQVDIQNAASDPLVEQYKVGPIPTVVFVAPSGQVASTIVGDSTYNNYEGALNSITRSGRLVR